MKQTILLTFCLLTAFNSQSQQPATAKNDTWGKSPTASDDRFSNPKSALYAGPDGWYNFGEVRAVVGNAAKTAYNFKGGFRLTMHTFTAVESGQNRVMTLDFGTDTPAVGTYQISTKANAAQKKVLLSFTDIAKGEIRNWAGEDGAGAVTVSKVNGFLYMKCRNVQLQPDGGLRHAADLKKPMTLGFEGAAKLD